ncbi:MAG: hypothetical protein IJ697_06870 [Synergistaceae bacterium]|nr:hypothetical protein [Synergistaceae bacterium]
MAYDVNDLVTVKQLKKSAQRASQKAAALEEAINNKISSVYKARGSLASASLTSDLLVKANEGNLYNITDAFTTTELFVEGAGKKHTAGTNVAVIETAAPVYTASSDTTIDAEKTYYVNQNGGYTAVTPAGNEDPSEEGWHELTTPATYKFDVHSGDLSNIQVLAVPTTPNTIAGLDATGQVIPLELNVADDSEVDEMLAEVYGD